MNEGITPTPTIKAGGDTFRDREQVANDIRFWEFLAALDHVVDVAEKYYFGAKFCSTLAAFRNTVTAGLERTEIKAWRCVALDDDNDFPF